MNANLMKWCGVLLITLSCLLTGFAYCGEGGKQPRILIAQGKDLRNESFGARRIVRRADVSYVGYSQCVGRKWQILVRPFDHRTGTFGKSVNIAPGTDDHSGVSLVADSKGFLHCITGGHGPVSYVRTLRPDDISQWSKPRKISSEGTYAMLMIDRRDRMYLFYRHRWINLTMQTCVAGGKWSRPRIIGTSTGSKGFYIMGVAMGNEKEQQSLHVVGHFYGSPDAYGKSWPRESYGYRIKPWYIRSLDAGKTWQKASGKTLKLPVTDKTIDILFDFAKPYDIPWSVDVTLDDKNRPNVFCVWFRRKPCPGVSGREIQGKMLEYPGLLWKLTWENGRWARHEVVSPSLKGGRFHHPAVICANGVLHVCLPVSGKLVHLWSSSSGQWREELLDDKQPSYANWKLPDASGVLELMWRGKPTSKGAKTALYYSHNLTASGR